MSPASRRCGQAVAALVAALMLVGCAAFRSDPVDQLAKTEAEKLELLKNALSARTAGLHRALQRLESSYGADVAALDEWDQEVARAKLVAAAPGDLRNPIVRRAIYVEIGDQTVNHSVGYSDLVAGFSERARNLAAAYDKLVAGAASAKEDADRIAAYAGSGSVSFAVQSIDATTIGAAAGEFKVARSLIAKAQKGDDAVDKALAAATSADKSGSTQEFTTLLSLLSGKVRDLKQ